MKKQSYERQVRLVLNERTHARFRVIAAEEEQPMAAVARRLVERYVASRPVAREAEGKDDRSK